ncbi:citryl-CoA lyase [Rhodococcus erythropolis]
MCAARTDQWTTEIAEVRHDDVILRGRRVTELMTTLTYTESLYLVMTGNTPTSGQVRVLDALMVSVMDHGISPTSTLTRMLGSYGVPIQAAIAGGVLAFGDTQGGAGEALAKEFYERVSADESGDMSALAQQIVDEARAERRTIPGFGHPQHGKDPRSSILLKLAREQRVAGKYCELLDQISQKLAVAVGRQVHVNVDGVSAALVLDLGVDWRFTRVFMIAPRVVGLSTHYVEELNQGNVWRHVPADQVRYTGEQPS